MNQYEEMIKQMANASKPKFDTDRTALLCIDLANDGSNEQGFFKQILNFDISLMQEIEPNVMKLIEASRDREVPVIGVQAIYDFGYIPKPMQERFEAMGIQGGLAPKGAWGSEIIPKVREAGLDLILVKSHYSAFSPGRTFGFKPGNKELEEYMQLSAREDARLEAEGRKTMLGYFREAQVSPEDLDSHLEKGGVVSLDHYLKDKAIDTLIITGASTHVCVDSTVAGASERGYRILMPIDAVAAEGIPREGHQRHFVYLSNHGLFKAELTTTQKLLEI